MRRLVLVLISGLMVVSMCIAFISCGKRETLPNKNPCSLDGVTVSIDNKPTFVLDEEASGTMSEQQLEDKQAIVSSLNRAIDDRPELASMLEADMIDGGSNDYVYEGGESFFKVVGEFADENYSKARRMFPEITCDEFFYHSAYDYAVCNHNPELFETPYVEFLNYEDYSVKYFNPTFDQLMSSAFWTSYCSERFGFYYFDDNTPFDGTFDCEDLDCESTFELAMMLHMAVKESLMKGNVAVGKYRWTSNKILSHHITTEIRSSLRDIGVSNVSLDDNDYFSQIGNVVAYAHSILEEPTSTSLTLGYLGSSLRYYVYMFYYRGTMNYPSDLVSSLCRLIIVGPLNGDFYEFEYDIWSISDWD